MYIVLFSLACLATSLIHATAPGFQLTVNFVGDFTAEQKTIFNQAKARWETVITGDLGKSVTFAAGSRVCGQPPLAADLVVDDIAIFATLSNIDGPGGFVVSSGPCAFQGNKVRLGIMQFDIADIADLNAAGTFAFTVAHEIGHILGIGTVWDQRGLAGKNVIQGTTSFNYFGGNGVNGQRDVGGSGNPQVEGDGGSEIARRHWDEAVYQDELMTGFLSGSTQPLSKLTIQSLRDLGYNVDVNKADDFRISGATAAPFVGTKAPTNAPVTNAPVTKKPTNAPITLAPTTRAPTNAGQTNAPTIGNQNNNNRFNFQFDISGISASQTQIILNAASKWESIILNDIGATVTIQAGQSVCGLRPQASAIQVDDIIVFIRVAALDGTGGTQIQAGPCAFDQANRIRLGIMIFDSADLAVLESTPGALFNTALHNLAHILGVGSTWSQKGLAGKNVIPGTVADVRYFGPSGIVGQKEIGGVNNPIVEGDGGPDIAKQHWDKDIYGDELMTASLTGSSPLSKLTIRSLFDIGYNIDVTKADAFTISPTAPPQASFGRRLRDLQLEANWEQTWSGEFVYDLVAFPKDLVSNPDQWEFSYTGNVVSLEDNSAVVDSGAIAGGVIGGLSVIGLAAAFVVLQRRKSAKPLASQNPMFGEEDQYNNNYYSKQTTKDPIAFSNTNGFNQQNNAYPMQNYQQSNYGY